MKKMSLLLIIALLAACFAAGCTPENVPEITTAPEITDIQEIKPGLTVIDSERKTKFVLIRPDMKSSESPEVVAAKKIRNAFVAAGIEITFTTDFDTESEFEIIVGDTERNIEGFTSPDWQTLCSGGYLIAAVGSKIVISGGTEGLEAAADRFIGMIPDSGAFELPADFRITGNPGAPLSSLTCGGVSLDRFYIEYPEGDSVCSVAAYTLRSKVFETAGVLMEESKSEDGQYRILLSLLPDLSDGDAGSFTVTVDGTTVNICGTSRGGLSRGINEALDYFAENGENGVYDMKNGEVFSHKYGKVVCYEDFGAKGDGVTDDGAAIAAAHEYANKNGLPVFAREDATYYIGGAARDICIMTDTDWSSARFIIDDRNVENCAKEVFLVAPSEGLITLSGVEKLSAGQKNIGIKLPSDCIVTAVNSEKKQYIRYGNNQNSGAPQQDNFLVDKDGNVSDDTPILWNFEKLTSLVARPVDEKTLTLRGGIFTTIANADPGTAYYYRGIRIYRSNVVVDGLKHLIDDEGGVGAPYFGFLIFNGSVNSEVRDCVLTGHKTYKKIGSAGTTVSMGTYDITATSCLGLKVINCSQTNDILDNSRWGVFASNYSKNIFFDGVSFSRFDAHQGVYNVTLRNCRLGHQGINLIGHGTALIENTTVYNKYFINLRSDYGSTWNGDLIIRNCTYIPAAGARCDAIIINGSNPGSHDFGYVCYLPRNIVIEGLVIEDKNPSSSSYVGPRLYSKMNTNYASAGYKAEYPMVMTESVTVSGLKTASVKPLTVSENRYMFAGLEIKFAD